MLAYESDATTFWQQAADLYRAEAALVDDADEAAGLLVEAGTVLAERLGAIDAAYAAFDAAQARAPESAEPLLARAQLARSQRDWTEAAECLRAALGRSRGAARVPLLSGLARICARHLGRPEEAVRLLQEAVTLAPDQRDLLIRLETARPTTETAARREVLERRLAVTTSLAERGERLAELGGLLEASAPARAARTFADAYAANPNWAPAVHGLLRTYVDLKRWDALARVLRTHAERITDDAIRSEVYAICGIIADTHQGNADQALADLTQAGDAVQRDRLWAADRAGRAEAGAWAKQSDPLDAPVRAYHLAAAGEEAAPGILGAVVRRRRALAADDDDAALQALADLARDGTADEQRVFQLAAGEQALWSTTPHDARGAFEAAARAEADPDRFPEGLIGLRAVARTEIDLNRWRNAVDRAAERAGAAGEILARWRAVHDPIAADQADWVALAERDPAHMGAVDMALRIAADDADLSACLDTAIDTAQSPSRRIRLRLAAAHRAERRGAGEIAEQHWQAVLALDPLNVTARAALGRRFDAAQDLDRLLALVQSELAALAPDDARRELAQLRLVELTARQQTPRAALGVLLDADTTAWSLHAGLRQLADSLGDDQALATALERASASSMQARVDALERAGVALDLGETAQAIAALDSVLADAPADIMAAWVRAHLAMGQGDAGHALQLVRQQLAAAPTGGLARVHAHRLTAQLPLVDGRALMAEHAATDADAAWYMLCDAASSDDGPLIVQRLEELAGLVGDRAAEALLMEAGERAACLGLPAADRMRIWQCLRVDQPERGTQALLALYREADDVEGQVDCLQRFAEQQAGPMQAAALWRAGLMLEDSLPHEASSLYWQAIEAWPDDPMALLLTLRVGEAGAPMTGSERAQQLEAIAARLVHDGRAARLLAAAAGAREGAEERPEAERAWLHAAMRYPERDALAERALVLLADADEARIALLEARARRVTRPGVRAATRQRLAQEYIDTRGDRGAAADLFAQIAADRPDDLEVRRTYARLLVGLGRHADAVEQYRRAAGIAAEPSERVALYTRIGELLGRHLGDLDGAIKALRQAIGLVDPTGGAQEVLAEVYLRAGQGHRALLAYQRLERMVNEPTRRAQAQAGQVRALLADERPADARDRLTDFLRQNPFEPLLVSLAQSLGVSIPEPEEAEPAPEHTNGLDLAELDRLAAALDKTRARQSEAEAEVARASAEASAALDDEAFDALAAALAQVTGEIAPQDPPAEAAPDAAPAAMETEPEGVESAADEAPAAEAIEAQPAEAVRAPQPAEAVQAEAVQVQADAPIEADAAPLVADEPEAPDAAEASEAIEANGTPVEAGAAASLNGSVEFDLEADDLVEYVEPAYDFEEVSALEIDEDDIEEVAPPPMPPPVPATPALPREPSDAMRAALSEAHTLIADMTPEPEVGTPPTPAVSEAIADVLASVQSGHSAPVQRMPAVLESTAPPAAPSVNLLDDAVDEIDTPPLAKPSAEPLVDDLDDAYDPWASLEVAPEIEPEAALDPPTEAEASVEIEAEIAAPAEAEALGEVEASVEAPLDADALIEAEAPIEADASIEADALIEADAPLEADALIEADAPIEADALIEADAPFEADALIEADAPLEADALIEADAPLDADLLIETESNDTDASIEMEPSVEVPTQPPAVIASPFNAEQTVVEWGATPDVLAEPSSIEVVVAPPRVDLGPASSYENPFVSGTPTVVRPVEAELLAHSGPVTDPPDPIDWSSADPGASSPFEEPTEADLDGELAPDAAASAPPAFDALVDSDDADETDDFGTDGFDDFFGNAPDLLDSLVDGPVVVEPVAQPIGSIESFDPDAAAPEMEPTPSAGIMRARGHRIRPRPTDGPAARSVETPSHSIERVENAAALAASLNRVDGDDGSRSRLAAVALRRQSGSAVFTPEAARARIAIAPFDLDAWASLRIAGNSGATARWIADMRAWIDGRLHTGSVVTSTQRLPDALREALCPPDVPHALLRLLRAMRTRVPLGLAQAHRPDSLHGLNPHDPLTEVADRVAVVLGCPMHDLMVDRGRPYTLSVLADAVPVASLGHALIDKIPEPGRSFAVARCLAVLAEGTLPAEVLDDAGFGGFLAALGSLFGVAHVPADASARDAAVDWLRPVIDPNDVALKALAAQALGDLGPDAIPVVRAGLRSYALRLALTVADGIGGSLEVMRLLDLDERTLADLSLDDRGRFLAQNPAALDLVETAASAPCLAIRDWLRQQH